MSNEKERHLLVVYVDDEQDAQLRKDGIAVYEEPADVIWESLMSKSRVRDILLSELEYHVEDEHERKILSDFLKDGKRLDSLVESEFRYVKDRYLDYGGMNCTDIDSWVSSACRDIILDLLKKELASSPPQR